MANYLDVEHLAILTRSRRGDKGLRETAQEIGSVSPSTLSRVENGKMPDIETFLRLCDWLGIRPAELIKNTEEPPEAGLNVPEKITTQLRADKNLSRETANALADLVHAVYHEAEVHKGDNKE